MGIMGWNYGDGIMERNYGDTILNYGGIVTAEVRSGAMTAALSYVYNDNFDVTRMTYAGRTEYLSYDDDRLLTKAFDIYIVRDPDNGRSTFIGNTSYKFTPTYNGYGEMDGQTVAMTSNYIGVSQWNLERDDVGRIVGKTETVGGVSAQYEYDYDDMGRLTMVTKDNVLAEAYTYGPNDERLTETNVARGISGKTYQYDEEDRMLVAGDTVYTYDLDGFLTAKYEHTGQPKLSCYWQVDTQLCLAVLLFKEEYV